MDRYTTIRSFALVAEKGSFAAAALAEGVTPVVMGRRLSALERRPGVQLMHRSTRGRALTDLGDQFPARSHLLLPDFCSAETGIMSGCSRVTGHVGGLGPGGVGWAAGGP